MTPSTRIRLGSMALLLVASVGLSYGFNRVQTYRAEAPMKSLAAANIEKINSAGLIVLKIAQAKETFARNGATFIDTRTPQEYEAGHVPGALNVPYELLMEDFGAAVRILDKSRPVIVYCSDILCPKAREVGEALKLEGFASISVMPDGYAAWMDARGTAEK